MEHKEFNLVKWKRNTIHWKRTNLDKCKCGGEMVYLYGGFRCVSQIQEKLAKTRFRVVEVVEVE